jgi:hypothetical protein
VKRRLVGEQWEGSSFRSYLYQETGLVRVKSQEWPMEIKARPVAKFGAGEGYEPPTNSQTTRMSVAHWRKLSLSGGTEGRVGNPGKSNPNPQ